MDLTLAELPQRERYKLLIGLVIPRPVAWISTLSANGVPNCAPFSFFNVFSEEPPLCIIGMNPRQSDGRKKHTLRNIERTREFVVNLADEGTVTAMQLCGDEIPEDQSEFSHAGLTPAPAKLVRHPRIAEAAASLECRLYQLIEVNAARWLVIGEILHIHAREGIVDPATRHISESNYRPVGRLFANRWCTTRQRFDLPGKLPE
jgi:flavin reductase (DIM6/NTAB) family NADH-FMN oxidoreductase RutF